jgi:hypothetical protein
MPSKSQFNYYIPLGISIVAALLDFISGSIILQNTSMSESNNGMMQQPAPSMLGDWWIAFLFGLGVLIVATGSLYFTRFGMKNMRTLGFIMILYGAIMIGTGAVMISGMSGIMSPSQSIVLGFLMLIAAVLMIFEGYHMTSKGKMTFAINSKLAKDDKLNQQTSFS